MKISEIMGHGPTRLPIDNNVQTNPRNAPQNTRQKKENKKWDTQREKEPKET